MNTKNNIPLMRTHNEWDVDQGGTSPEIATAISINQSLGVAIAGAQATEHQMMN